VGIAVSPALEIIFDTLKTSRKYPNLQAQPSCSLVIGWDGEETAQFEGLAIEPGGEELSRYQEIYFATWPDGRVRASLPQIVHIVVKPRWIRYCDYRQNPPGISEITP
jgi:hypothetical protein